MTTSKENYLKAVLYLQKENGSARCSDISELLEVKKPSVSNAMKALIQEGFLLQDNQMHYSLTDKGLEIAIKIDRKFRTVYSFLAGIGVSESNASLDVARIEHVISDETISRLQIWINQENTKRSAP